MSFYVSTATFFLLHCDEWDRVVALPRHKFVTGATLLQLGFLRRNLRGCPQDMKTQAYTTLVRPVLEYASTVWDPYTLQQIYALERIQRQAARFVTGDYSSRDPGSVTRMLQQLQWDTLEERRARNRSIMLYRILNNRGRSYNPTVR